MVLLHTSHLGEAHAVLSLGGSILTEVQHSGHGNSRVGMCGRVDLQDTSCLAGAESIGRSVTGRDVVDGYARSLKGVSDARDVDEGEVGGHGLSCGSNEDTEVRITYLLTVNLFLCAIRYFDCRPRDPRYCDDAER